ncbi:MAG: MmgE/PrpD family protein [Sneathiella sp.]|nr:MmgE/PrpD family protein [Sneathiella sp.]
MSKSVDIVGKLANWAAHSIVPASAIVRSRANAALIDGIGCIYAGSKDDATEAVFRGVLSSHGVGRSRVYGRQTYLSPAGAALVNGTAAHALDFDDNFMPAITHATAVLVPALLSVGENQAKSGREIADAYVMGLELQARIGALVNPNHYEAGWHATSTVGTIGTAGALAYLMNLTADKIAVAMSVAFSLASGSKLQFGTATKPTHAGFAAHNAVLAAVLASSGLTAQIEFLTKPWGFQDLYGKGSDVGGEIAIKGLGEDWAIEKAGLAPKRFPCCGAAHKALDAVESIMLQHNIKLEDVEAVTAYLPGPLYENLRFDAPQTASEGRFSFSYPAARLMKHGALSLSHFTDEAVTEKGIQNHLDKFRREKCNEPLTSMNYRQRVTMRLKGGQEIEAENIHVKGSIQNPFTEEEEAQKFRDCLSWSGNTDKYSLFTKLKKFELYKSMNDLFGGEPNIL